jgi:hypothetical protein
MAEINGKSMNTSRNKCFAQSSGGAKMIKVKYTPKNSQDGYQYKTFETYGEYAEWLTCNYAIINVWETTGK